MKKDEILNASKMCIRDRKVDERIYDPLMEMLEAAKEGNLDQLPMVVSGYRTQKKQQQLYDCLLYTSRCV